MSAPQLLFHLREPVRPETREEALALLRHRADIGRRCGFLTDFGGLPLPVQAVMYGIAAQLEYVADFFEDLPRVSTTDRGSERGDRDRTSIPALPGASDDD